MERLLLTAEVQQEAGEAAAVPAVEGEDPAAEAEAVVMTLMPLYAVEQTKTFNKLLLILYPLLLTIAVK